MIRGRPALPGRRWFSRSIPEQARDILDAIAREYEVPIFEMQGPSHAWAIVSAREEAARRLRAQEWHPQAIGMFLRKHPTSVRAMLSMIPDKQRRGARPTRPAVAYTDAAIGFEWDEWI